MTNSTPIASHIGICMHYGLVKQDILMPLAKLRSNFVPRFMSVLVCLVFSVLSTIEEYKGFANETLFWMVGPLFKSILDQARLPSCLSIIPCVLDRGFWTNGQYDAPTFIIISSDFCSDGNIFRKYVWWRFLGSSTLSVFGRRGAGGNIAIKHQPLFPLQTILQSISQYFYLSHVSLS